MFSIAAKGIVNQRNPAKEFMNLSGEAQPAVILYDMSLATVSLNEHSSWWPAAAELAQELGCHVLSVGHTGPRAVLEPGFPVDYQIRCDSYYCKIAGHSMNVHLTFPSPPRPPISLRGRQSGSLIVWDAVGEEGVAEPEEAPKKPERNIIQERWT